MRPSVLSLVCIRKLQFAVVGALETLHAALAVGYESQIRRLVGGVKDHEHLLQEREMLG